MANDSQFFKDRHYLDREFDDLGRILETPGGVCMEVGCGVGNTVFPLLERNACCKFIMMDFSDKAIELVKQHTLYDEAKCKVITTQYTLISQAYVVDITEDKTFPDDVAKGSVDVITLFFVLSTIHPDRMHVCNGYS